MHSLDIIRKRNRLAAKVQSGDQYRVQRDQLKKLLVDCHSCLDDLGLRERVRETVTRMYGRWP